MHDIFFLSYDELNADKNWEILNQITNPKRVHGIKGIPNARKKCAEQASTENFYIVTGDSHVLDSMNFSFTPDEHSKNYTHVWKTKNPFLDLEYSHGGIKLFNTAAILATSNEMPVDFTLSVSQIKIVDQVGSITAFNTDEVRTWTSAFHECARLALNNNKESYKRLDIWTNFDKYNKNIPYFRYCLNGARCGEKFANLSGCDYNEINYLINDFDRLNKHYEDWHSGHIRY